MLVFGIASGALILSYLGVATIRRLAIRHGVLDTPNERSSHQIPTPRGGGVAIAMIVLLGFAVAGETLGDLSSSALWGYLVSAAIIASVGIVDDLRGLSALVRLVVHVFAAGILVSSVGRFDTLVLPWFGVVNLGWLGMPFTLIWIVGLVNTYNFMDGIDGLAAGQAAIAGLSWLFVLYGSFVNSLTILACLIVGASLGFLMHNLPPARIFMGDVGSTLLGFTFAALPILVGQSTTDSRLWLFGVLCIAPFAFDGAFTIVRRAVGRENVLQAHRSHLYQRLVKVGYSHGKVSLIYGSLAFISGLIAVAYLKCGRRAGESVDPG